MRGSPLTRTGPDPGVADLWTLPEYRVPELAARMGGPDLLAPDERARHDRLLRTGSRRRFLGGRLLARLALGARTGLPPDTWRFVRDGNGRPEPVPDTAGLRFNLSHTDGLIVCVLTRGRGCGADVERIPFDAEKTRLLNAFLGAADPDLATCERWVLAEAYLKGVGVGLAGGLRDLRFRHRGGGRFTVVDARRPDLARRWRLDLLRPSEHHLVAVATEGGGTVRLREPSWGRSVPAAGPARTPVTSLPDPLQP
ncbi:4-phosphopantetheinyl transferase [Streptomyces sp. NPDC005728]|uniref:4'-phosphopantetheinyl transferase family protein n=1 Tax=Streptomyces sp. NPDC005728 TaxID=3157054 RepID=UPI0033DB6F8F